MPDVKPETLTLHEFAVLVDKMRRVQKAFFKGDHSSATLETAKSLERQTDKALADILDVQKKLF
jgi:hypothetical protein